MVAIGHGVPEVSARVSHLGDLLCRCQRCGEDDLGEPVVGQLERGPGDLVPTLVAVEGDGGRALGYVNCLEEQRGAIFRSTPLRLVEQCRSDTEAPHARIGDQA